MRAALYARFSTELQNDRSVDDQLFLCSEFARRTGYSVAGEYSDKARSGSSTHGRDGLQRLLEDARAGRFEAVVVEALDRLSRDQEDLAGIHKRLSFAGIDIIAVHDGKADAMQVGIRGLVSTLFLSDLKHKIRRGMAGVVREGRHAGGKAYGYDPTPGKPGILVINETEAAIVRRIFDEYVAGATPRDIAAGLNADGIPAPRGIAWNASTINGSKQRGNGILRNPVYAGTIVWNRVRMVRDPDTGHRLSRVNDHAMLKTAEAPHLAIVDRATFDAAQNRKAVTTKPGTPGRRRKRLLSGLLRCGCCGGGMTMHDARNGVVRVRCSTHRESGGCENTRYYRLDRIEGAVVGGVHARLDDPRLIHEFLDAYQEENRTAAKRRGGLERKIAEVRGKIDRLIDSIERGILPVEIVEARVAPLEAERQQLLREMEMTPDQTVVVLSPARLAMFKGMVENLEEMITDAEIEARRQEIASWEASKREILEAFRSLVHEVIVWDREDGGVDCEIIGQVGALIDTDWGVLPSKSGSGGGTHVFTPQSWGRFAA